MALQKEWLMDSHLVPMMDSMSDMHSEDKMRAKLASSMEQH